MGISMFLIFILLPRNSSTLINFPCIFYFVSKILNLTISKVASNGFIVFKIENLSGQ